MKQYCTSILLVMLTLCVSCGVDTVDSAKVLTLSEHELSVPCTGGTYELNVESNSAWSVEIIGEGISSDLNSGSGNATLHISVGSNQAASLTGIVRLSTSGLSPVTSICKFIREAYPVISINQTAFSTGYSGGKRFFVVTSNKPWKVTGLPDYVIVTPSSGDGNADVEVTVAANTTFVDRSCTIAFSTDYDVVETASLTVNQTAKSFVTPAVDRTEVVREGGSFDILVDSNLPWKVESVEGGFVAAEVSNGKLVLTVEPNSDAAREAVVTLATIEESPARSTVTVVQAPDPKIALSQSGIETPLNGGKFKVQLTCNTDWTASINGDASLIVNPTSGSGSSEITIEVAALSGADRNWTITFATQGANSVTAQLAVTQSGNPTVSVNPVTINSDDAARTSYKVAITSNTKWSVVSHSSGIESVSPSSGDGNAEVTVSVAENQGDALNETVVFETESDDKRATLTISRPSVLVVSSANMEPSYEGGTGTITIKTIKSWTISSSTAGPTLSAVSGSGNATVTVTFAENNSQSDRSGQFTVSVGVKSSAVDWLQHLPSFVLGGETYLITKLKDGRWWMSDNMRYLPSGTTPATDPTVESGIWYPYTDYVATTYKTDDEGNVIKDTDGNNVVEEPASWRVLTDGASVRHYGYFYDAATAFGRPLSATNYKSLESIQGICPGGWHIPTESEVATLIAVYKRADNLTYLEDLTADGMRFVPSGMRQRNSLLVNGVFSSQVSEFITTSTGATNNETTGQIMMKGWILNGNNMKTVIANQSVINAGHIRCIKN